MLDSLVFSRGLTNEAGDVVGCVLDTCVSEATVAFARYIDLLGRLNNTEIILVS